MKQKIYEWLFSPKIRYSYILKWIRRILIPTDRELIFNYVFRFVDKTEKRINYLEFGVYKGNSLLYAYEMIKEVDSEINFYVFDCFKGLPIPSEEDYDLDRFFYEGAYYCSKEEFMKIMIKNKIDFNRLHIIEGLYKHSLTEGLKKKIGFANIICVDCDYYSSTKYVLNFITDLIRDGSIIIFGGWFNNKGKDYKNQRKVFYEWIEKTGITFKPFMSYDSFILYRNNRKY